LIATVLDEVMVWACAVKTKRFAYCAELNLRFLRPLKPEQTVIAWAELVANRKQRIFEAKGELKTESGVLCASAMGKYLPIKESETAGLAEDFVGDMSWV